MERLAEIFDNENLQYRISDNPHILLSGFPNTAIALILDRDTVKFEARWRGEPASAEAASVLAVVNEWNLTQMFPAIHFVETAPGVLAIITHRELLIAGGVSRNQLGAFITSSITNSLGCFQWVEQQFPELVTWENPHSNTQKDDSEGTDE